MTNAPQFFFLGLGHGEGGEPPYELLEVHGAAGVRVQDVHHALEEGGWERVEGMGEGGVCTWTRGLPLSSGMAMNSFMSREPEWSESSLANLIRTEVDIIRYEGGGGPGQGCSEGELPLAEAPDLLRGEGGGGEGRLLSSHGGR